MSAWAIDEVSSRQATYTTTELVGSSEFSRVYRAVSSAYYKGVVLRYIKKSEYLNSESVKAGFALLSEIHHTYLSPVIEWFELPDAICCVTDWFDGVTLRQYLDAHEPLSEEYARNIFAKLLDVVEFLHERGLSHRNISDDSVLMGPDREICVVGMTWLSSNTLPEVIEKDPFTAFDPPEAILKKPSNGVSADSWALGVLLYTLIMKNPPWRGSTPGELYYAMTCGNVLKPAAMSVSCHTLVLRFLDPAPTRRFSAAMAKQQPWMLARPQGLERIGRVLPSSAAATKSLTIFASLRSRTLSMPA
jgi:serine/threonine protein kinase